MPDKNQIIQPLAYILLVEAYDAERDLLSQKVGAPTFAVDMARDEDEAVAKALEHRPDLIIVKQHHPFHLDELRPPAVSVGSRICRRARLNRSVRVVTHTDAPITLKWSQWPAVKSFPDHLCILARPNFEAQDWRKEWYSYSSREATPEFLSKHLQFWLRAAEPAPSLSVIRLPGSLPPWSQPEGSSLN